MIQAFNNAVSGLQRSELRIGQAANDIVTSGVPRDAQVPAENRVQVNLPNAFVDMKQAEHSYKASLAVLITAQEMSSVLLERENANESA
jgi:hypothetical protein